MNLMLGLPKVKVICCHPANPEKDRRSDRAGAKKNIEKIYSSGMRKNKNLSVVYTLAWSIFNI